MKINMEIKIKLPPKTQNKTENFCNDWNGTPIIIMPKLNKISFFEMQFFLKYKVSVTASNKTASIQNGIATFCKNKKGMPTIVIPIKDKTAIIPRHRLWQT